MDAGFAESVRELMTALASGGEPSLAAGGGMTRVFRETGAVTPRAAVEVLVDRWFRAAPAHTVLDPDERLLNRPDVGESEKLHATLHEHVIAQRRWQELSNNESTFYRYRRAAIGAFGERLWSEIVDRPLPTNRPLPEYARFIGRQNEVATLLRWLGGPAELWSAWRAQVGRARPRCCTRSPTRAKLPRDRGSRWSSNSARCRSSMPLCGWRHSTAAA